MTNIRSHTPAQVAEPAKPAQRPVYALKLRPEPGVDGIRALRAVLKGLLRRHGLRCVAVVEVIVSARS